MPNELKIEQDKDGNYVIPGDEDATKWLQEAMLAIAKTHNLPTNDQGMPTMRWSPSWQRTLFRWRLRLMHAIGLHYFVPVTEYDAPTGSMKFSGERCLVCGKR